MKKKRDLRMIVGFIVMTVFVVMMVSVTMAAFKYLNDSDYQANTRIFIMNHAKERVMDKNTDLKNFRAQKKAKS